MTTTAKPYKNVSGRLLDLHDGRQLEPGKERNLTDDEAGLPHNLELIDRGALIEAQHTKQTHKPTPHKQKESD